MFEEIKKWDATQIETRCAQIEEEINTADEEKLDELRGELEAIKVRKSEIELQARRADMAAVAAGAGKVIERGAEERSENNVLSSKAYVDAYANFIKTGNDKECRSLLTSNASGALPVPTIIDGLIRTAWENDQIMSRVRKTYFRGNAKVTFERSATGAVEHNEGSTAPSEEELTLGIVEMIPKNIKKWITLSDEAVAMGGEEFLRYIYDELTYQIVKKMAALGVTDIAEASASHSGSAVGIPQLSSAPSVTVFQKALTNLSGEADANRLCVLLNPASDAAIIDAVAQAAFAIDPYAGLTKIYTSALPAYSTASANKTWAIVGDLSALQYNFPEGDDVVIKWDELSLAEADMVKVVGREYAAHAVTGPGRLCNIVKPNG